MSKATKHFHKQRADLTHYSFAEPVVRTLTDKVKGNPEVRRKNTPSQREGTKTRVVVFHRRKNEGNDADILGVKDLTTWRKSSGHNKSWRKCRRFKLTQAYLELLTISRGHPVSFGWQFSATNSPSSFVRGQGLYVNKQSKPRRSKKSSNFPSIDELNEGNSPPWSLLRDAPRKHWRVYPDLQAQYTLVELPKRFFRLRITREGVNITTEVSLGEMRLSLHKSLPLQNVGHQGDMFYKNFVVLRLVGNESHADVYLVQGSNKSAKFYHAHVFLSEGFSGNESKFARRKIDRLRKSHDFHDEIVQSGRKIIVMKIDFQRNKTFHLKNTQQEFPPLPTSVVKSCKAGQKKYKRSYATILSEEPPSKKTTKSNHIAYIAWQERQGTLGPKKGSVRVRPNKMNKLDTKVDNSSIQTIQKRVPNIPLMNRFTNLSCNEIRDD